MTAWWLLPVPADGTRYPTGCPDPDWCRGNRVCYWRCQADPDEDLHPENRMHATIIKQIDELVRPHGLRAAHDHDDSYRLDGAGHLELVIFADERGEWHAAELSATGGYLEGMAHIFLRDAVHDALQIWRDSK